MCTRGDTAGTHRYSSCHTHTHTRQLPRIRSTSSSAVNGPPLDFCLHRHPVPVNCLYHARMVLSVGGSFAYFARNARCTVTPDLLCDILTHKTTSAPERPFSHYIHSHRLATDMWTTINKKNNLMGGRGGLSCSFYLHRFRKTRVLRFSYNKFL
jgi:hypothetical protein